MSLVEPFSDVPDKSIASPPSIDGIYVQPRCRVCRDDEVRKKVNDLLAAGYSYAMILRALGDADATPGRPDRVTIDSIRNHAARHFPVQHVARATYREIVERRAREAQIDFETGVIAALTPMALYECVMNEAFRRLVDGSMDVGIDTGLRAAEKLQALVDARAADADMTRVLADVDRIIKVVHAFIPQDRWPEVQAMLQGESPISQHRSEQPQGVRMVEIDDTFDEDGD